MPPWTAVALDPTCGDLISPAMLVLAYLDPGTGSFAFQILLATLFGGLFALKQGWSELKARCSLWYSRRTDRAQARTENQAGPVSPEAIIRPGAHGQSTAKIHG